jgi:hypothetical protein
MALVVLGASLIIWGVLLKIRKPLLVNHYMILGRGMVGGAWMGFRLS